MSKYNLIFENIFYPSSEKVLIIKEFLDNNFKRVKFETIDINGYPSLENGLLLLSKSKTPIKNITAKELLRMLDDKFNKIISDKNDRKRFLKQVIKDWYTKKITDTGILSVNYL